MAYYYKRTESFENMSYEETTLYFQKITECYLKSILTLTSLNSTTTNLNERNIGRIIALSKMLNKNYVHKSDSEFNEGSLLQSWVSLGAVLEACLHSFLKINSNAYSKNPVTYYDKRKKEDVVIEIERLTSYNLIEYFFGGKGIIQAAEFEKAEINNVRINRNLIHIFAGTITADWEEINNSLKLVIEVILDLISRLPEIETEFGYLDLCDPDLYSEVYKLKREWFVLKDRG